MSEKIVQLICNDLCQEAICPEQGHHKIFVVRKASRKSSDISLRHLTTLIYVDSDCSLPTGQWSAVSSTV